MKVATHALALIGSLWENPWFLRIAVVSLLIFGWIVGPWT